MEHINLKELFELQEQLDKHIVEKKHITEQTTEKKIIALIVELGECANEDRFFKYWSNKGPSPKEVILEEFADCLHFVLSIGNDIDHDKKLGELNYMMPCKGEIASKKKDCIFTEIIISIGKLQVNLRYVENKIQTYIAYLDLLAGVLEFGYSLGFSQSEIAEAYIKKNKTNHKRQEEGY